MELMDLFRPKWKHSDWHIRESAVENLEDQALLTKIAIRDKDWHVREKAKKQLEILRPKKNITNKSKWYKSPWLFWTRFPHPISFVQSVGRGLSLFGCAVIFNAILFLVDVVLHHNLKWFSENSGSFFIFSFVFGAFHTIIVYLSRNSRQCFHCKKQLKLVDMSRGVMPLGGILPDLYNGVVCGTCLRLECMECKGNPPDTPCRWCGSVVSPAYKHLPWIELD